VNALRTQFSWTHYRKLISIDDAVVKFTLPKDNQNIIASKYQLYLPTEKQLLEEMRKEIVNINKKENKESQ
jgi:hypothetical protein